VMMLLRLIVLAARFLLDSRFSAILDRFMRRFRDNKLAVRTYCSVVRGVDGL
jgi:hypothetical protein